MLIPGNKYDFISYIQFRFRLTSACRQKTASVVTAEINTREGFRVKGKYEFFQKNYSCFTTQHL